MGYVNCETKYENFLFLWKTKYANLQPFEKGQSVLLGTQDSHIVLNLPVRLLGVDDPCLR